MHWDQDLASVSKKWAHLYPKQGLWYLPRNFVYWVTVLVIEVKTIVSGFAFNKDHVVVSISCFGYFKEIVDFREFIIIAVSFATINYELVK